MDIKMIPIEKLYDHPANRKDLGDVSEMADSMKVMGVLQNLVVVPYDPTDHAGVIIQNGDGSDCYVIIAGHRRKKAALKAKLRELPCAISNMDIKAQIRTMQVENLMREGLTTYQQAKAIQMMLDMGETVEQIAKETGFSKAKVEKRAKLTVFDPAAFAESESRNPSMNDYLKLAKLEDETLRNELLASIGTANFENDLAQARDKLRKRKIREEQLKVVEGFAKRVVTVEPDFAHFKAIYSSDKAESIKVPADADTREYFFTEESWAITVYRRKTAGEITAAEDKAKEDAKLKADFEELKEASLRAFELRVSFMNALTAAQAKRLFAVIASHLADYFRDISLQNWPTVKIDHHLAGEILNIKVNEKTGIDSEGLKKAATKCPERTLLIMAYLQLEDNSLSYAKQEWRDGRYIPVYQGNEQLDRIYRLLTDIGYQMSDEETEMKLGTHPLYYMEQTPAADKAA